MTRDEKENKVSTTICALSENNVCEWPQKHICKKHGICKVREKSDEQLDYVLSPIDGSIFLEACAGSGKTEVLGMKAAYEICRWGLSYSGIAVLTFTNEAANAIRERVQMFSSHTISSRHYIGTFAGFVHGYIAQKFGYSFYGDRHVKEDCSFSLIDKNVRSYSSAVWLNNYKLEFPVPPKQSPVYANQLFLRSSDDTWQIQMGDDSVDIVSFFNRPDMQNYLDELRRSKGKAFLFQFDYLIRKILECKAKFMNDGFANFDDMNLIVIRCLENEMISKALTRKFPLILVDECQDLSHAELKILSRLSKMGSVIHYVGDLNQAIYSFKDAHPEHFAKHMEANSYTPMYLSDNFRSCQQIVNVAGALQSIGRDIVGHAKAPCLSNSAVYYEYDDNASLLEPFMNLLQKYSLSPQASIVLTRNSSLKHIINAGVTLEYEQHPVINAIQLWNIGSQDCRREALMLLGLQIQKWMKSKGRRDNYYCPDIFHDVFRACFKSNSE